MYQFVSYQKKLGCYLFLFNDVLGSEIAPAATAFTAALLSQLLEFIAKYLKVVFPTKGNEVSPLDQHDEILKMKKKLLMNKRKRKRRRRMSSHSSDHTGSEQEDDLSDLSDLSEGKKKFKNFETLKKILVKN